MESIGAGLQAAAYVVVIITPQFFGKDWTESELANAVAQQNQSGNRRLIPVVDMPYDEFAESYPLLADTSYEAWPSDLGALAKSIQRRLDTKLGRGVAPWHFGKHPVEYVGPVWTRVTPAHDRDNEAHQLTLIWGPYVLEVELGAIGEPLTLTHHKQAREDVPLQAHVRPAARVTFGQGPPPDAASRAIDLGWDRMSGVPID